MWLSDERLALLIMLIIAIPVQNHAVKLNMPISESTPQRVPLKVITTDIAVTAACCGVASHCQPSGTGGALVCIAASQKQSELHRRPNKLVEYKSVATVLASAQRIGMTRIGIVGSKQCLK